MSLLAIISLINCAFLMIFFALHRITGMSYMEMMVARKLAVYFLTFIALVIAGLMLLEKNAAAQVIGYTVNIVVAATIVIYLIRRLLKTK